MSHPLRQTWVSDSLSGKYLVGLRYLFLILPSNVDLFRRNNPSVCFFFSPLHCCILTNKEFINYDGNETVTAFIDMLTIELPLDSVAN